MDTSEIPIARSVPASRLAHRYYSLMLSPVLMAAIIGAVAGGAMGEREQLWTTWLPFVALMAIVILVVASVLYRPIAGPDSGSEAIPASDLHTTVRNLPAVSAALVFVTGTIVLFAHYLVRYVFCSDCSPDFAVGDLAYHLGLVALLAAFLAVYTYFVIGDFTVTLRTVLTTESGIRFSPGDDRLGRKLTIAFTATSLLPIALLVGHSPLFDDFTPPTPAGYGSLPMERMAMMDRGAVMEDMHRRAAHRALMTDAVTAVLVAIATIVLISRALSRPISYLAERMPQVPTRRPLAEVPIVSDDEIGRLGASFNTMISELGERDFVRETLGRFVPPAVADAVLADRGLLTPQIREATILFTDIEGFTATADALDPAVVLRLLNDYFAIMAEPVNRHGGVITQFQGDAMLVSFNLPVESVDHARRALSAALEIGELQRKHRFQDGIRLPTRVGVYTGPVVGGIVGPADRLGYTVHGNAVNLASRLEQLNKQFGSRILVSARTRELAGDGFRYLDRGRVEIRGHREPVRVYELTGPDDGMPAS